MTFRELVKNFGNLAQREERVDKIGAEVRVARKPADTSTRFVPFALRDPVLIQKYLAE